MKDDDPMQRTPSQHAAGGLAVSAFIAVTQILTGITLDISLYVALGLFAATIPFQIILFYARVPKLPPKDELLSWPHITYTGIQWYSTILIVVGFTAMFWHFGWWLGVLFAVASYVAFWIYRDWANKAAGYDPKSRTEDPLE
jgi:cobalamin synthase